MRLKRDRAQATRAETHGDSPEDSGAIESPWAGEREEQLGLLASFPSTEHLPCARLCATSLGWGPRLPLSEVL